MTQNSIWIVDIEPLDNRYTKQWRTHIPKLTFDHLHKKYITRQIIGHAEGYSKPQAGAFFNFAATCEYKAVQAQRIAQAFSSGMVKDGDVFFFTDAWNQTVHTVKYISELLGIKVKLAGIWHAGWYDPTDILGLKIKNEAWVRHLEYSMFSAYDMNFFGTQQHLDKFAAKHTGDKIYTMHVCGYPLEYIRELANTHKKEKIVVFPHRLNEDKAPHVFDAIRDVVHKTRPDISFVKTQEHGFTKEEYYEFLKKCKVIFSANKHENLGIGTFEAMTAGCIPLVPNKLSYAEMYNASFKYNCDNCDESLYELNSDMINYLAVRIIEMIDYYDVLNELRASCVDNIQRQFFDGTEMMRLLGTL